MLNANRSDITIMVHFPSHVTHDPVRLLEQLRKLLDICEENSTSFIERWERTSDAKIRNGSAQAPCYLSSSDMNLWPEIIETLSNDACSITMFSCIDHYRNVDHQISLIATIKKSNRYTMPMINDEKIIRIDISNWVWQHLNQEKLIEALQNTCLILGATYACIDLPLLCPLSIYAGGFRTFCSEADTIDPETKIPGIQWGQFISAKMLTPSGSDRFASLQTSFGTIKALEDKGLWVQLSDNILHPDQKSRMLFREYFSDSLYNLSLDIIAGTISPTQQFSIQMLPLTDSEKQIIQAIRAEKGLLQHKWLVFD